MNVPANNVIISSSQECSLCGHSAVFFQEDMSRRLRRYYRCGNCHGIFMFPGDRLSMEHEKERYLQHNNDMNDPGYRSFVFPLVNVVCENFFPGSRGLDFGAGPGPVITTILREKGYDIEIYDPFFRPDKSVLKTTYDFVVCCEVIEHFCRPHKDFLLLRSLIAPGGMLFCMTDIFRQENIFKDWYYKNDPTHVFFYTKKTLEYVKEMAGFSSLHISGRTSIFGV